MTKEKMKRGCEQNQEIYTEERRRASSSERNISLLFFSRSRGVTKATADRFVHAPPIGKSVCDTVVMIWVKDNGLAKAGRWW
jgi:hypothetical protein